MNRDSTSIIGDFMTGGGELGELVRSIEWSHTPVGPVDSWPQSLRTAISIMLNTHFPMYKDWGDGFTQFYNDGYRPIPGSTKHPAAMGLSTIVTFGEIWKRTKELKDVNQALQQFCITGRRMINEAPSPFFPFASIVPDDRDAIHI